MEITIDSIPGGAIFYDEYADDLFKVKIYLEGQKIVGPIYGYGPNSEGKELEVERHINHLLPYVHDVWVKRVLLENLIVDARFELDAYDEELNTATPEELRKYGNHAIGTNGGHCYTLQRRKFYNTVSTNHKGILISTRRC